MWEKGERIYGTPGVYNNFPLVSKIQEVYKWFFTPVCLSQKKKKKVSTKEKRFYSFLFALSLGNTKKGNNQQISHVKTHITAMRRCPSTYSMWPYKQMKIEGGTFFFYFILLFL